MFNILNNPSVTNPLQGSNDLEGKINDFLFSTFPIQDPDEIEAKFKGEDVLDIYRVLEELDKELSYVKIENCVLEDFLQKNDPNMLVGVTEVMAQFKAKEAKQRIQFADEPSARSKDDQQQQPGARVDSNSVSSSLHSSAHLSMAPSKKSMYASGTSFATNVSSRKKAELRINYHTKAEMTEKLATEIRDACEAMEAKGSNDIKNLNAKIEELQYRSSEADDTWKNFQENVINIGMDPRTGIIASERFVKFVHNWLKNGMAMLGTMRLRITALQEQSHQQRAALIRKADLSGILGPIDFEQMQIKRDEYTKVLDDKNVHLLGLKTVTGKASLALTTEKKVLVDIETTLKKIYTKMSEINRHITKLSKESRDVENEINISRKNLEKLQNSVNQYEAPTVNEYINRKEELLALEKEEKLLHRQIYILNIKLKNAAMKAKKQKKGLFSDTSIKTNKKAN